MRPFALQRSYFLAATRKLLLVTTFVLPACGEVGGFGGNGDDDDGEANVASPQAGDLLAKGAQVTLAPLNYRSFALPACVRKVPDVGALPTLSEFTLDGDASDWDAVLAVSDDPLGDAPAGYDLGALRVALNAAGDVVLFFAFLPAADAELVVDFGGAVVRGGQLALEKRRRIRLFGGALFEMVDEAWRPLAAREAQAVQGSAGLEMRLSQRLVADATNWPAWWLKPFVRRTTASSAKEAGDGEGHRLRDAATASFFQSLVEADQRLFRLEACREWAGQQRPLTLHALYDASAERAGRNFDFPEDPAVTWALAIGRAAWGALAPLVAPLTASFRDVTLLVTTGGFAAAEATAPTRTAAAAEAEADSVYLGVRLDIQELVAGGSLHAPQARLLEQAALGMTRLVLAGAWPRADDYLLTATARALVDVLVRETLGWSYWLDTFAPSDDASRFGHLLSVEFEAHVLVDAWQRAAGADYDGLTPAEALLAALSNGQTKDVDRARAGALWQGWLTAGGRVAPFELAALDDRDFDGLPNFIERHLGTDPLRSDSDYDGWSDLAELVLGKAPLVASQHPGKIVPDQNFDDWLTLVPRRVTVDRGHGEGCPAASDISHYAAAADGETLVIGAHAGAFGALVPPPKWEALVDLPKQERQLLVTTTSGERTFDVKDPSTGEILLRRQRAAPLGLSTIEWTLDRRDFGLAPFTEEKETMRIRLRTVVAADDGRFCDETAWFAALFSI